MSRRFVSLTGFRWIVIGEAVQTILRREGEPDAYERVKAATRGEEVTLDDIRAMFESLDVDEGVKEELRALTPAEYVGVAEELVDELDGAGEN